MLLLEAKFSLKSSRQVTRSMEGQDRMQRSDSRSLGPEEQDEAFRLHSVNRRTEGNDNVLMMPSGSTR